MAKKSKKVWAPELETYLSGSRISKQARRELRALLGVAQAATAWASTPTFPREESLLAQDKTLDALELLWKLSPDGRELAHVFFDEAADF